MKGSGAEWNPYPHEDGPAEKCNNNPEFFYIILNKLITYFFIRLLIMIDFNEYERSNF